MKKAIIIITIFLSVLPAFSKAESELLIGQWSSHFKSCSKGNECINGNEYNENHRLIGYTYKEKYSISYFKNSYNEDSLMITKQHLLKEYNDFKFFVSYGAVVGYEDKLNLRVGNVGVAFLLSMKYNIPNTNANVIVNTLPTEFVSVGLSINL